MHSRSLPGLSASEADGTEERHGYGHPCLPCRLLQEALPELHPPEEESSRRQLLKSRSALLRLSHRKCRLDSRLHG